MNGIDTASWSEFRIGDLFYVVKGSRLRSLDRTDGTIPYVGASLFNNGYTHSIGNDEHVHPGNVLTTAYNGTIPGKTFYQPEPFWATDDVNVLYPKFEMTPESGLFIAPAIEAVGKNYVYVDKWKLQDMIDAVILLPAAEDGEPDWPWIEAKMADLLADRGAVLDAMGDLSVGIGTEIDTTSWSEFRIGDLFEVVKGSRLRSVDRTSGNIPYVGATLFDNGYVQRIGNDEHVHPAGVLTVCYDGPVGTTFYQAERFWATDSVNVLYPRFEMSELMGLFLVPVIEAVGKNYDYTDKWKLQDMISSVVRLPAAADGTPDWCSVETMMSRVIDERMAALDRIRDLVGETGETASS